jgi:decaprenylphospho-beta-D-ribofuranose 2-oxidase
MKKHINTWGNIAGKSVLITDKISSSNIPFVAFGNNNSYGDAPISASNTTFNLKKNKNSINDPTQTISNFINTNNKFLFGIPGKSDVTLAGAIASDTHGKDNVWGGSFSKNIEEILLTTASGKAVSATREKNEEIFYTTIGGYGLTGIISDIKFREEIVPFSNVFFTEINFGNGIKNLLNSFKPIENQYWVGWVDLVGKKNNWYVEKSISRNSQSENRKKIQNEKSLKFGFSFVGRNNLNSMKIINQIYFLSKKINFQKNKKFNDVFYPLGVISDTRNFAKKRKIVQVQFSLPIKNENKIQYLIDMLIDGQTPILCSVKRLTHNESNLNFSFVQDGWTFAVDFPYETFNKKTIRKFYSELIKQEGKVYLAKDISLNEEEFKSMYPNYRDWLMVVKGVDPDKKFQSEMSVRLGLKKW